MPLGPPFNQNTNCDTIWTTTFWGDSISCKPACTWNDDLGGDYPYPQHNFQESEGDSQRMQLLSSVKLEDLYGFRSTYSRTNLNIWVRSPEDRKLVVRIFDINGNVVSSDDFHTHRGENFKSIEISKYIPGAYVFAVSIEGTNVYFGKFFVRK